MQIALAGLAVLALLAGCLTEGGGADAEADGPAPGFKEEAGRHDRELGAQHGFALTPSRFRFDVTVPEGGASLVRWTLVVENGPAAGHHVEGPGCGGSAANVNVVVQVGLSHTVRGSCDDLPAGTHAFEVVITLPAPAFQAVVVGAVQA